MIKRFWWSDALAAVNPQNDPPVPPTRSADAPGRRQQLRDWIGEGGPASATLKPLLHFAHLPLHGFMGELIDVNGGLQSGFSLVSGVASLLALGLYALLQGRPSNDDDDSNPGGGLMQPVA